MFKHVNETNIRKSESYKWIGDNTVTNKRFEQWWVVYIAMLLCGFVASRRNGSCSYLTLINIYNQLYIGEFTQAKHNAFPIQYYNLSWTFFSCECWDNINLISSRNFYISLLGTHLKKKVDSSSIIVLTISPFVCLWSSAEFALYSLLLRETFLSFILGVFLLIIRYELKLFWIY